MKSFLNRMSRFWFARSLGILLIRLEVGFVFFTHGLMKVEHMVRTMQLFAGMGLPSWVAFFIAWLEVIGGAALMFGIATRIFAVMFGIQMLVAVALSLSHAVTPVGWQSVMGGMEMFLAIMSFALALMGSGHYALLPLECRRCGGMLCGADGDCPGEKNK